MSLWSLPCLDSTNQLFDSPGSDDSIWKYTRNDPVSTPSPDVQYRGLVGPPDGAGTHDGQVPQDNESICVTCRKTLILLEEAGGMDLSLVSSQYGFGGRWWGGHCRQIIPFVFVIQGSKLILASKESRC